MWTAGGKRSMWGVCDNDSLKGQIRELQRIEDEVTTYSDFGCVLWDKPEVAPPVTT
jgi:hypothetical protein